MEGYHDDVVVLRSGQVEWRINGLELRVDAEQGMALALTALTKLGWSSVNQLGLEVDGTVSLVATERLLNDERERLRASGRGLDSRIVQRPLLVGTWGEVTEDAPRPKVRRFAKEAAAPPVVAKPNGARKSVRPSERTHGDPSIDVQLFDDPEDQLRYEIKHWYLMTVPPSQREQWPLADDYYLMLPSFVREVAEQSRQISHSQIIAACVDVLSTRMFDVTARRPRPLREGGGQDHRAPIVRADGATAWRANISAGTPAARRIMWWRTPAGEVELARVATHDDVDIPER